MGICLLDDSVLTFAAVAARRGVYGEGGRVVGGLRCCPPPQLLEGGAQGLIVLLHLLETTLEVGEHQGGARGIALRCGKEKV